jgi:two-component sensor histidine kinase|tara:strand:- start:1348 stop:2115 length:768 start_codon:yes stop_codon:yes gene_type:complete
MNHNNNDLLFIVTAAIVFLFVFFIAISIFIIKSREDRVQIEEKKKKIEEMLTQKTVLLKEIHHRVKNNLQLTSSLLYLQASKHNDPKTTAMVEESQKQINSIALVHEMLYQDDNLSFISMNEYLKELGNRLLQLSFDKNITYHVETNNVSLPIDYATTLGLILNELVTNSLKYAFKHDEGIITVRLEQNKDDKYQFTYSDNGKGLVKPSKKEQPKTLGVKLIKMFAEEIDAKLEIVNKDGLSYHFIFKNKYETNV